MAGIEAIRICPECKYHETASSSGSGKLLWTGSLVDVVDLSRCQVTPGDCPHVNRAEIRWAPSE